MRAPSVRRGFRITRASRAAAWLTAAALAASGAALAPLFAKETSPRVARQMSSVMPLPRSAPSATLSSRDLASLTLPGSLGHLLETWQPPGEGRHPVVWLLQDLHLDPQAQQGISHLLEALHRQTGVRLVALEGGSGRAHFEFLERIGDAGLRERGA